MKKYFLLIYLFLLTLAFTGCSDDKANWEKLPETEIKGQDITISGVGNNTGSIQLSVMNSQQGSMNLKNIVYGAENVDIDVVMTEKGDDSFDFSGSLLLNESTKATDLATNRTLKINGNITIDGKASVHIATEASGGLVGTWSLSDTLVANNESADTLYSTPFLLRWPAIQVIEGQEGVGTDGRQIAVVGSILVSPVLAEVLGQVNFNADGNITANYYPNLPFDGDTAMEWLLGHMGYFKIEVSHSDWNQSPKDLAYWYAKDKFIYVVPDIEKIMKQVAGDNGKTDTTDYATILTLVKSMANATDEQIEGMLTMAGNMAGMDLSMLTPALVKQVANWLTSGIPLKYRNTDYGLEVYVDKDMAAPFMPLVFNLLPELQNKLDEMAVENPMIGMLPMLLSINKLTDIENIWKNNTKAFESGITLKQ